MSVPEPFEGALLEADHNYDIGRYAEARKKYLKLMEMAPNSGELLYKLAFCEYQLHYRNDAIQHCTQSMEHARTSEKYALLGLLYRTQNNYKKAEELFTEGLAAFPYSVELRAQYAYSLWLCGQKQEARALMDEALSMNPMHRIALYYKLHMEEGPSARKRRMQIIQQYMETDITEVDRLLMISTHLYMSKRYRSARKKCREAFVLDPTNTKVVERLRELDKICHPVFFPVRLFNYTGRSLKIWMFAIQILLIGLNHVDFVIALYALCFILAFWSRKAEKIYESLKGRCRD